MLEIKQDTAMQNEETQKQDQEILGLLKDYPMPEATAGYFDQALVRATHEGSRRQRNRWLMTGFGSAIAAGLVLWVLGGFFLTTPGLPRPGLSRPHERQHFYPEIQSGRSAA